MDGRLKRNQYRRQWAKANPSRRYQAWIKRRYGVNWDDYEAMLKVQEGRCAICVCSFPVGETPHLDHDHATNENRGLLCRSCNLMIGLAGDDPAVLESASRYLKRFSSTPYRKTDVSEATVEINSGSHDGHS